MPTARYRPYCNIIISYHTWFDVAWRLTLYNDRQFKEQNSWYLLWASTLSIMSKLVFFVPHHAHGTVFLLSRRNVFTHMKLQNFLCCPSNWTYWLVTASFFSWIPHLSQLLRMILLAYLKAEKHGSLHSMFTLSSCSNSCLTGLFFPHTAQLWTPLVAEVLTWASLLAKAACKQVWLQKSLNVPWSSKGAINESLLCARSALQNAHSFIRFSYSVLHIWLQKCFTSLPTVTQNLNLLFWKMADEQ